jgi:lipoprotein-anchoring transpeptidase ErfK/SrfK
MGAWRSILIVATAVSAAVVAGCSTAPKPVATAIAPPPTPPPSPYRWTQGDSAKAQQAMLETFAKSRMKAGEYVWAAAVPKEGDTRVVVDLLNQMVYVYRGDALVGASTVSSGKEGKETPLGIWPILQKQKFHRSRKYNDAPMPFMQRLDEYGVALHGGNNPGYPASHGCVRLPMKFAEKLFSLTKVGTVVVIEG